jgi:soluble P-type ATPase
MGDGATDLAMRSAVDAFAVYTGFVHRENVVSSADIVLASFDQLLELVLG